VLAQPDIRDSLGLRDHALVEKLYSARVRRLELDNPKLYDQDTERAARTIRQGKEAKDRSVTAPPNGSTSSSARADRVPWWNRTMDPSPSAMQANCSASATRATGCALHPRYGEDRQARPLLSVPPHTADANARGWPRRSAASSGPEDDTDLHAGVHPVTEADPLGH
jgi:hypothetical protein